MLLNIISVVVMHASEMNEDFMCNMKEFGWDFERLENEKKISILTLSVSKGTGVQTNITRLWTL